MKANYSDTIALTNAISDIPFLSVFLGMPCHPLSLTYQLKNGAATHVLAWGRRPSAYKAMMYAQQNNKKILCLEDGFLRSLGLGRQGYAPLSLVVDDVGIYFDASAPSRLEYLIEQGDDDVIRANACIAYIDEHHLSKYNHAVSCVTGVDQQQQNILLVDQTVGDQSVVLGGATAESFEKMFNVARQHYPDAIIWVKTHPEVSAKQKQGYLSHLSPSTHLRLLTDTVNPIDLIKKMDAVYVVTSHMGFEALMLGKPVYCFGMPWYAGWGVTYDDDAPVHLVAGRRTASRSLTQLFTAAYIQYARYVDPITGKACDIEEALAWLTRSTYWNKTLAGELYLIGFSRWKIGYLKSIFHLPAVRLKIMRKMPKKLPNNAQILVWGSKEVPVRLKQNHAVWRMEDGFIRSVGLGAKLVRPMSLMIDSVGLYYDPAQPSYLENWLNECVLSDGQRTRALSLQATIVALALSKYNVGHAEAWPSVPQGRRCILVAGQVEDDASVRCGGGAIQTNLALLQAVRQRCPEAFIVYKPHPDVQAGLRVGRLTSVQLQVCDAVIEHLDMPSCLAQVDEVHTLTSLTGFEALLRGIPVTCYGMPFYAGWGLTTDLTACKRRRRRLTLEELVYGALIAGPIYVLPQRTGFAEIEQVIQHIQVEKQDAKDHHWSVWRCVLAGIARIRAFFLM